MGWIKSAGEADFHLVGSTDSPPAVLEERQEEEWGRGEEEKEETSTRGPSHGLAVHLD